MSSFYLFIYFYYHFLQLYRPNGISPMGNSDCLPRGQPAATESRNPIYGACWVFSFFYNPQNSDMDYGIFDAHTDVRARDCTRGCADTVKESALSVDSVRKIPCRTGESNLRWLRACPMLYQLSYIPIPIPIRHYTSILFRYLMTNSALLPFSKQIFIHFFMYY